MGLAPNRPNRVPVEVVSTRISGVAGWAKVAEGHVVSPATTEHSSSEGKSLFILLGLAVFRIS